MAAHRRDWLKPVTAGRLGNGAERSCLAGEDRPERSDLTIVDLRVTPIALTDPPLLAASGCHGPYFLRDVVELQVEGGIVGIAEAPGGNAVTTALERARHLVVGTSAFAYRRLEGRLVALNPGCYAGIELACLDACGRGTGQRLCELVGGPVRDSVEFAAHLFYRYAADHPVILADPRLAALDSRGRGQRALDAWGEVRTTEAMAGLAEDFRKRWGFRVFKLKGGVLPPEVERESLEAMAARLGAGVPPLKGERMRVFFDAMRLETIEAAQVVVQSPKP